MLSVERRAGACCGSVVVRVCAVLGVLAGESFMWWQRGFPFLALRLRAVGGCGLEFGLGSVLLVGKSLFWGGCGWGSPWPCFVVVFWLVPLPAGVLVAVVHGDGNAQGQPLVGHLCWCCVLFVVSPFSLRLFLFLVLLCWIFLPAQLPSLSFGLRYWLWGFAFGIFFVVCV